MASDSSKPNGIVIVSRNFLTGVFLSGVLILAYLWLSVDMTSGSWAAVGTGQWIGALLMPLCCGVLSAALGRKIIDALTAIVEGAQLPF